MTICNRRSFLLLFGILISIGFARAEIIEESGSLREFFAGREENCAYDNWVSHISEGIAQEGYNAYCPVEHDRQTNGFGTYQIIDSLANPDSILADWYKIFANILAGDIGTASEILDSSSFSAFYELVDFRDGDDRFLIVREVLDTTYFDNNGTEDAADDVRGSFRYGWGLYIFNTNPRTPEVVIEIPHPNDDFITPYIGIDAFLFLGASAIFVSGAGREVKWSNVGAYDNSRSRSDPTRVGNHSVFQEAHEAVVDSIVSEFILPIHSYDSGGRDLAQSLLSAYPDNSPGTPVLDWLNHYDILHLTPLYPILPNSIGNAEHTAVRIDDYYAIWVEGATVYYNFEYVITNYMPSLYGWPSPQRSYSEAHRDSGRYVENYMHIEHDEFPDVITEEILSFYPSEGVPTYASYANAVAFYRPLYNAVWDYFHRSRICYVPEDFATIQAAIDNALGGDTIVVHPGVYRENINFHHKNLILTSNYMFSRDIDDIDSTLICGNDPEVSLVTFLGEEWRATLSGFTITGGRRRDGAGIFMMRASPTIDHCVITGNFAAGYGGGVFCEDSRPVFNNCSITGNSAEEGGGIFAWNQSHLSANSSIFFDNSPQQVKFHRLGLRNRITCEYSDVENGQDGIDTDGNAQVDWLIGNIDADPLFIDRESGNFRLIGISPCVNSGSPLFLLDPDSTRADMGALPSTFRTIVSNPDYILFPAYEEGVSDSSQLMIYNVGVDTISILSAEIFPPETPFRLSGFAGESILPPWENLPLTVTLASPGWIKYRAVLRLTSNVPGEETVEIDLMAQPLEIGGDEQPLADDFELLNVFPNPFNSTATVRFSLPGESDISLGVFDLTGRQVARLAQGSMAAGRYERRWNADRIGSGLYFIKLEANGEVFVSKALLIK